MDNKDSILILGAGIYQVPLIKKAQEMGLRAVITSIPGNYPGFAAADKVYYANTTDKDAVLDIARSERGGGPRPKRRADVADNADELVEKSAEKDAPSATVAQIKEAANAC